jgi:hypothetical protein
VTGDRAGVVMFWVHGSPARSFEQVAEYLTGDAHDRSKVQVYDGKHFHSVIVWGEAVARNETAALSGLALSRDHDPDEFTDLRPDCARL